MDKQLSHEDELLAQFLEVNMRAAIKLYQDPRRRHLLEGEETLGGALSLLLRYQLAYRTSRRDDDKTQRAIKTREKRHAKGQGQRNGKLEEIPYLGVYRARGGGYRAVATVSPGGGSRLKRNHEIGVYPTMEEAAKAYDDFMTNRVNGKLAKTNANTGRLGNE